MFGLFKKNPEKEARQLQKAALEVIDYSRQTLRPETVRAAALLTAEHLERVEKIYGSDPVGPKRALVEYQALHTEARRKRDDAALTAFTLVKISARAEIQGDIARDARNTIDAFVAEWAHAKQE